MAHELEHGIGSIDRIAHRGDDLAARHESFDALERLGVEKVGTNLDDLALAGRVAKMSRVPVEALVVEGAEIQRLLNAIRQIDVAFEHVMQPGSAGASGADAEDLGEPAFDGCAHPPADRSNGRAGDGSITRRARGFFHAERSIISNSSSASTSGR